MSNGTTKSNLAILAVFWLWAGVNLMMDAAVGTDGLHTEIILIPIAFTIMFAVHRLITRKPPETEECEG